MNANADNDPRVVALLHVTYTGMVTPPSGEAIASTDASSSIVKEMYQIFEGTTLRVGRAKTNDIVLNDRDVSRFHATFSASDNGIVLSDLASTNGTLVNGRRVTTPVDVMSGDVVTLGNIRIDIQLHYTNDIQLDDGTRTALSDLQTVEATVLLVDVVAYTRISQDLPPDDVTRALRHWFEMAGPIIAKHGGEIDKYIGDCVMALWRGSAHDASVRAAAALTAGIEIVEKTKNFAKDGLWQHDEKYPWRCRAALNSGTALFGAVGAGDRRNYTVLGDAINVAFRIEGLAGRLKAEVICSKHTADLVSSSFELVPLGAFDLEGRIGEMTVFTVRAATASSATPTDPKPL